ncbi:dephospho-CoA kinase [Turneriella parva]|uniref:Dephospho-CoA kinase n=1 Tax=Turneriella parva (strain ATCC BAA-1111 / DSM 21527 / NCTC 11395 / H) TaxID=869212 RepID=I4BBJ2_TURPD|nr:dephospho-CoA kinase [Turneriella parva]AFM14649.1 Dephospho-CoA kinase [Turneriella parva DSM 21527]
MKNPYARVYGLTGVMGSGKSTAAKLLAEAGVIVLDADSIARDVIDPQSDSYADIKLKLIAAFEPLSTEPLFRADGSLVRAALAKVAFADSAKTKKLGEIMHPHIQAEFSRRVAAIPAGRRIVYDVPLLFEGRLHEQVKKTIVVYAPEEICVARAVARAAGQGQKLTADEARARLGQQISIEKKRELADYVIDNSGDLAALRAQVTGLCQKLE